MADNRFAGYYKKLLGFTKFDRMPDAVLAPMSGITGKLFHAAVRRARGAGLMVCEMEASHALSWKMLRKKYEN